MIQIKNTPLTEVEKKLIVLFLEKASDEFSNHGCNDFDLIEEGNLTEEQVIELDKNMWEWNGTPEYHGEHKQCRFAMDWFVMSYLAGRVKSLI